MTAPLVSLAIPAMVLCADTRLGTRHSAAATPTAAVSRIAQLLIVASFDSSELR